MPSPTRNPQHLYIGRRPDRVPLNLVLDREARDLLDQYAPGRAIGRFVARLIFEHDARVRERDRITAKVCAEVDDEATSVRA